MEELLRQQLTSCAAAYTAATGISRAKLGDLILNDNTFFKRVLDERQGFTVRTFDRVTGWMADNWPEGAVWPDGIRPSQARQGDANLPAVASAHQ